jgi:iron complex outermembrane receptor protein
MSMAGRKRLKVAKLALAVAGGLWSAEAGAQTAAEPAPSAGNELPPVVVETKAKSATKKAAAKKAPKPVAASPSVGQSAAAPEPAAAGGAESAKGPVNGIAAERSATGTKTDTPLLETPRTVNVIPREQIEQQQAQSISEALRYTPGVVVSAYGHDGILESNNLVRGFIAPRYLDGLRLAQDPATGFIQNSTDAYMFERIEVLKGSASALYGQAPPGGLINLVSKRPTFEEQNEVQLQTGSFNRMQAAFDFNGVAGAPGTFAYRVVGLARDTDLQVDYQDAERYFISPSFTWKPSADTTFTLLAHYAHNEGYGPHHFVPLALTKKDAPFGRIPYSRNLGDPTNDNYTADQFMIGYEFEHRFSDAVTFRQNLRYSYAESELLALRSEGLASDVPVPPPFPPFPVDYRTIFRTQNYVAGDSSDIVVDNHLQVNVATGPVAHQLLFGVDYQYGSGFLDSRSGLAPTQDAYDPVYGLPMPGPELLTPQIIADFEREQIGVYVQDQMAFDRWRLTLGGRFDRAQATIDNAVALPIANNPLEIDDHDTTGFAGLSYIFDSGFAPYASYSTSFDPSVSGSLQAPLGDALKPTTGEGYEIGIKYQPRGLDTLITAAWFEVTQQNVVKLDPINTGFATQVGEVEVQGVEVEIRSSLTRNLDIIGAYTNQRATIADDQNAGVIGNNMPNVPEEMASLWAMYTWHDGPLAGLGLGGGVRYVGSTFADDANDVAVGSYTLFDAAVSYDVGRLIPDLDGLHLQLNVTNLFNEYYVNSCYLTSSYCLLGAERAALATATYRW